MTNGNDILKLDSSLLVAALIFYVPNLGKKKNGIDLILSDFSKS